MSKKKGVSDFSFIIIALITIVLGSVFISFVVTANEESKYSSYVSEEFMVNPSASNVTTLAQYTIRNGADYITVEANGTEILMKGIAPTGWNYTVTNMGSQIAKINAELTYEGLDNTKVYDVDVTYQYVIMNTTEITLTTLIPVVLILVVVMYLIDFVRNKLRSTNQR